MMQDFCNVVTLNQQLTNELTALCDSNQNIKTEKINQTGSKIKKLAKAEVQSSIVKLVKSEINMTQVDEKIEKPVAFTSTFDPHNSLSANFLTEDIDLMLQEHTLKKRFSDDNEGLTSENREVQVKKP